MMISLNVFFKKNQEALVAFCGRKMSLSLNVVSRSGKPMTKLSVSSNAPVLDLFKAFAKEFPKYYVSRQRFTIGESKGQALAKNKKLSEYGLKNGGMKSMVKDQVIQHEPHRCSFTHIIDLKMTKKTKNPQEGVFLTLSVSLCLLVSIALVLIHCVGIITDTCLPCLIAFCGGFLCGFLFVLPKTVFVHLWDLLIIILFFLAFLCFLLLLSLSILCFLLVCRYSRLQGFGSSSFLPLRLCC